MAQKVKLVDSRTPQIAISNESEIISNAAKETSTPQIQSSSGEPIIENQLDNQQLLSFVKPFTEKQKELETAINEYNNQINSYNVQIEALKKQHKIDYVNIRKENLEEINKLKGELLKQSNRNIEVIGIFSSVLALLIINANIVISSKSILSAVILIIGLTSSISIFALLIHYFFNNSENKKIGWNFWIPNFILILLIAFSFFVSEKKESKDAEDKTSILINNQIDGSTSNDFRKDTIDVILNNGQKK